MDPATATTWLGDLLRTFAKVFPRLAHVKRNERAVCYRRGEAANLPRGMHFYWPVWSEVEQIPSERNDLRLDKQILPTADGQAVLIRVAVIYKVRNSMKALVETYDYAETVKLAAASAVADLVTGRTLAELVASPKEVKEEFTGQVKEALAEYGLKVVEANLIDGPVPSRALMLAGLREEATG